MSSSENSEDEAPMKEEINDGERTAIRSELSKLSFEELQKLKEKIGAKVYKEALFGSSKKDEKPKVFKRENKNRPREMSSKKPVRMVLDVGGVAVRKQTKEVRDPRFDPLCGDFDKKQFSQDYNFISDLRLQDIKAIRAELKQTEDPEREAKLRGLLQRLTEQHRVTKKKKIEREKIRRERSHVEQEFKEGKQPHFRNKSELRVEDLVKQYEELKSEGTGRIQRHLKRRHQKMKKRSDRVPAEVN